VDSEAVRALLASVLPAVDGPVLDFLAAAITEEEGRPLQFGEELVPMLLSAGVASDEAATRVVAGRLEVLLVEAFGVGAACAVEGPAAASPEGPTQLPAPVCLGAAMQQPTNDAIDVLQEGPLKKRGIMGAFERADNCSEVGGSGRGKVGDKWALFDKVPLSRRVKLDPAGEVPELRPIGSRLRPPRQKHAVGLERPLQADAQLKVQVAKATIHVPLQKLG